MAPEPPPTRPGHQTGEVRRVLARDGRAMLLAAVATVAVQLGVYLLAVLGGAPKAHRPLAALAAAVVWVALAAPVLAAAARDALSALLRAGSIVDASAISLLVLWIACPEVRFAAAAEIYCVLAAMAMPGVAACRLARSAAGRYALAVTVAAVLLLALASPFWLGGALRAVGRESAATLAAAGVHVNPFYAVTAAVSEPTRFVWHQAPVMYRITRLGDYAAPPPPRWYAPVLLYGAAGVVLAALAAAVRRRRP